MKPTGKEVSDTELKKVIADFLDQGHVENIVAMFRSEPRYYCWIGDLIQDERFSVRLGVSVLFEELKQLQQEKLTLAIPSLLVAITADAPLIRGEAASILGIIGSDEALHHVKPLLADTNPQVREMAELVLGG